jgi:DtxR family Mn-dependent transcriptional regulator
MSEEVERRLVALLDNPQSCPHGNPIPGLDELGGHTEVDDSGELLSPMTSLASVGGTHVIVRRISEQLQSDSDLMLRLKQVGIQPGREVTLAASDDGVRVTCDDEADSPATELPRRLAEHVFVAKR